MIKVNGVEVEVTKFPNGESLIRNTFATHENNKYHVAFKFESDADFIHLAMVKHQIDCMGGEATLRIPYLPYSRMDRTEGKNVFTLKVICNLINSLNFKEVHVLEPHSDVCIALLDRVIPYEYTITTLLDKVVEEIDIDIHDEDFIVFPDGGAEKRYAKHVQGANVLTAVKHRDFTTGDIKSLEIIGQAPKGFNAIIVDDLCSKGGTFMLTANKLKEMGANKIYLAVTHCETHILNGDVLKDDSPIEKVFTTNSLFNEMYLHMGRGQFKACFGSKVKLEKLFVREVF